MIKFLWYLWTKFSLFPIEKDVFLFRYNEYIWIFKLLYSMHFASVDGRLVGGGGEGLYSHPSDAIHQEGVYATYCIILGSVQFLCTLYTLRVGGLMMGWWWVLLGRSGCGCVWGKCAFKLWRRCFKIIKFKWEYPNLLNIKSWQVQILHILTKCHQNLPNNWGTRSIPRFSSFLDFLNSFSS